MPWDVASTEVLGSIDCKSDCLQKRTQDGDRGGYPQKYQRQPLDTNEDVRTLSVACYLNLDCVFQPIVDGISG
jgi:hypothetical protein